MLAGFEMFLLPKYYSLILVNKMSKLLWSHKLNFSSELQPFGGHFKLTTPRQPS